MINEFLDVYRRRRNCFMVCRKCGAEIKDGDMFCARCGTRTEKAESSSQGYYQTEERTVICKYCGKLIPEKSVGCPYCGKIIGKQYSRPTIDGHKERDNPMGFGILGFLFPLVGLILYLVWKDDYPEKAYAAGSGALWGFILAVAAGVIAGIVVYIQTTNMLNSLF